MILSLEKAKAIDPNATQGQLDGYESAIRQLTANKFLVLGVRFYDLTVEGTRVSFSKPSNKNVLILPGDTLQITDAGTFDEALVVVDTADANGFTVLEGVNDGGRLRDGRYSAGYATLVRYPADVAEGVKRLIEYDRDMGDKLGIKAETISRMSVTYYDVNASETVDGYPASLMSFLRKYDRMRWGS